MEKSTYLLRLSLSITVLTSFLLSWAQPISYKSQGSTLLYQKIDDNNVEITKQNTTLKEKTVYIPAEISYNDTIYYVTKIAENAFSGNIYIKEIIFAPICNIQEIEEGAFAGCSSLTEIKLPTTITEIKPYTFAYSGLKSIEIHEQITRIGERAFTNCQELKTIIMGENVEVIDNYAFALCPKLISFTIPEKTQHLGYEILQSNNNLDTIYYNAINCKTSGAYYDNRIERTIGAFEYNNNFSEIIFGEQVEHLPEYLLYNCHSIDSIYFPKTIKTIDRFALHNTEWYNSIKTDMLYVNNILYAYKGDNDSIFASDFKENTTTIATNCFKDNTKLKYINFPSNILYIYNSAFENCSNLKEINLPYDLEILGDYAFKNCKNLTHVKFNNLLNHIGKYCFCNCFSLQEATLPASLKSMKEGVFYNCESILSANIPNAIKNIPAGTFSKCPNLERVNLHGNITSIQEYAFAGCTLLDSIIIPAKCTRIGNRAFSHCTTLSQIDIKSKFLHIEPFAFYKCESIYYIDLKNVKYIGNKAFSYCTNLSYISIGKDLIIIEDYAFEHCKSLYSIELPKTVTQIGKRAFSGCSYLSKVKIDNATTNIGAYAFANCQLLTYAELGSNITDIGTSAFFNCLNLTEIELKHPLEKIADKCFANCENLKSITLPQGIESIGEKAFAGCKSLSSISIPNTTTLIKEQAFYECNSLTSIEIPNSIEEIQPHAFGKCYNLTKIIFNAENCKTKKQIFDYTTKTVSLTIGNTVQNIDDYIFYGMNIESVTIPSSVNSIEKFAFANSLPLKNINIQSNSDIKIDNSAFNNTTWFNNQNNNIIYIDNVAFKYIGNNKPKSIIIKEGTTAIASNFMTNNTNLEQIVLPQSLSAIGPNAFAGCSNLKTVIFPNSLNSIYESAFANCSSLKFINIPASISIIDNSAFENCTQIDSINLNNAYCSIGSAVFRNCSNMKKAKLGNNITQIGNMAFAYCSSLRYINSDKEIILPPEIKIINTATFYNCTQLRGKITIPKKVESIGEMAFEGCHSINSVELSSNLRHIDMSAFDKDINFTRYLDSSNKFFSTYNGVLYSSDMNILFHCPQGYNDTYVVHNKAKIVDSYAFNKCTKIQHVILYHIEEIKDYAFNGCTNLKRISLGKNIQNITYKAFNGCINLEAVNIRSDNTHYKSEDGIIYSADMTTLIFCPRGKKGKVKIPRSVQNIADYAFYGCNQITEIITHKNIKNIEKNSFTDCNAQINKL